LKNSLRKKIIEERLRRIQPGKIIDAESGEVLQEVSKHPFQPTRFIYKDKLQNSRLNLQELQRHIFNSTLLKLNLSCQISENHFCYL